MAGLDPAMTAAWVKFFKDITRLEHERFKLTRSRRTLSKNLKLLRSREVDRWGLDRYESVPS
jgi:hypothetical protein